MTDYSEVKARDLNLGSGRGKIGVATPSKVVKARHRKEGHGLSLRAFARKLAEADDQVAIQWWLNKQGGSKQSRSENNRKLAATIALATKQSRQKPKK